MTPIGKKIYSFSSKEISGLFRSAQRIFKGQYFDVLRSPARYDHGRLLAIAPKKIGTAPKRNKIKRQLKAIYYENQLYLKPFDYMVICKKDALALDFSTLKTNVLDVLNHEELQGNH